MTAAVHHLERAMVQSALARTAGVDEAAKMLGLSRKGLYLKSRSGLRGHRVDPLTLRELAGI